MKKIICYFCVATHLGGAERSLLDLLRRLTPQPDFTVKVLLPRNNGPLTEKLKELQIPFDVIEMPAQFLSISRSSPARSALLFLLAVPWLLQYLFRLRKYFLYEKINILHTTGIKCHLLSWLVSRRSDIEVVWHLRDILAKGFTRNLLRKAYFLSGKKIKAIANSSATARSLDIPCTIIYNGLDLTQFRRQSATAPRPTTPVVGVVGILARWKGQIEFLKMVKELNERGRVAEYWIVGDQIYDTVGDNGYREKLWALSKELGLKNVKFLGYQENIPAILSEMDILVHASVKAEPFGRVLIEAQACGVAVAASGAGGVLEIIEHNANGLLFVPGDPIAMADQVELLIQNQSGLRARLDSNARERLESNFCLDVHVNKVKRFYQGL